MKAMTEQITSVFQTIQSLQLGSALTVICNEYDTDLATDPDVAEFHRLITTVTNMLQRGSDTYQLARRNATPGIPINIDDYINRSEISKLIGAAMTAIDKGAGFTEQLQKDRKMAADLPDSPYFGKQIDYIPDTHTSKRQFTSTPSSSRRDSANTSRTREPLPPMEPWLQQLFHLVKKEEIVAKTSATSSDLYKYYVAGSAKDDGRVYGNCLCCAYLKQFRATGDRHSFKACPDLKRAARAAGCAGVPA